MKQLLSNIRFYVLTSSILLSGMIFALLTWIIPQGQLQIIRLEQTYGLLSLLYLYITLLAGPFCYRFKLFPFRAQYLKARRALGVSVFYFAFLHSIIAFFGQLGGFNGLGFL